MKHKIIYQIVSIIIFMNFISCRKENIGDCEGNCKLVNVKGFVYDITTNQPIVNRSIQMKWKNKQPSNCLIYCPTQPTLYSTKTNAQGKFSITINVDTSLTTHYLDISTSLYGTINDNYNGISVKGNFQDNLIGLYPFADIKIKLHRSLNDTFVIFGYSAYTRFDNNVPIWPDFGNSFYGNEPLPIDTIIQGKVIANLYTKIKTYKRVSTLIYNTTIDSVICSPDSIVTYNINY
jgi:hypothetical protein